MSTARSDFRKLWVGQTISEIGSRITREGLPLTAVMLLGATPAQMGVLSAASSISVLLVSMAAGVIADRYRRRPLMIGMDLARALLLATIPLAAGLGALSFGQLLVVAVMAGVLTVQFDVAYQSYLPSLVPREDLFEGNRRLGMSAATAEVIGPAVTGVLIQAMTAPRAILLDAVSFLVSAASVWLIRTEEPQPVPERHESMWHEALLGARTVWAHPVLRALALRSVVFYFSVGLYFPLYVLYAIRVLHFSTSTFGVLIAMGGVGALTGAYLSDHFAKQFGSGRTFLTTALFQAMTQALIPLASYDARFSIICMGASQFFGDLAWSVYNVSDMTLRQHAVSENLLGRVNAFFQLASRGVLPLGALIGGSLAGVIGIPATLWTGFVGCLISCAFLLPARTASR